MKNLIDALQEASESESSIANTYHKCTLRKSLASALVLYYI